MRTSNLIQSYIQSYPTASQYNADKAVKDFDVNKELANRTFIKPLPSNGKLVKNSIFDIPSQLRKDILYDIHSFQHAAKGVANDHELGRLNDVGMKIGSLAIASYLFTKKQTPMTKLFEFIGFGTFFAAMDLWPKLFIQLPAYLIHGVNVRQQYEDNFGRKKMFYQDHQFIPWDLYSDNEINKIGDRLRVPKDIPNRREFIQEKMRKIALQNNTLWMLTAGFATPVMSALMCNVLEQPMSKYLSKVKSQKADKLMSEFSKEIKNYKFEENQKALQEILTQNAGKSITPELFDAITMNLTEELDYMISNGLLKDLKTKIPIDARYNITDNNLSDITDAIRNSYKNINLSEDDLAKVIPSHQEIKEALASRSLIDGNFSDFTEHSKVIQKLLQSKIDILKSENAENPNIKKLEFNLKKFIHSQKYGSDSDLFKSFKQVSSSVLTDDLIKSIKKMSESINRLKAKMIVLEQYSFLKAAQAPETGLADSWNETEQKIFKAMKFTPEEIKKGRLDREIAGEILRNKMESIASDKSAYTEFIEIVQKELASMHNSMSGIDMTQDASQNSYKSHVNEAFESASNTFKELGMQNTVDSLIGYGDNNSTSAKALMFEFIENRKLGVKSSFYRLLSLADLYRRIATTTNITNALDKNMLREVKEECVELAKTLMLEAHTSDFAVKFWQRRNPDPNKDDYSNIEVDSNGKVKNKYYGNTPEHNVELANDREYFKSVMRLMYQENIHPDTSARLKDSGTSSDFKHYRTQAFEILGGDEYFAKAHHIVGKEYTPSTSLYRFLLMGSASDEMTYKYFNNMYNSKKWFSMFGKLGAVLACATIGAQFFFGKMKLPKEKSQEVK